MSHLACPGSPMCQKTFQYVNGLRAHRMTCSHAQGKIKRKMIIPSIRSHSPEVSSALIQMNRSATSVTLLSTPENSKLSDRSSLTSGGSGSMSTLSLKPRTATERARDNLAIRNNVNKGSVLIARQGAVNNFDHKLYATIHREYTTYWALEELPQLANVYRPRRDNVRVLMNHTAK